MPQNLTPAEYLQKLEDAVRHLSENQEKIWDQIKLLQTFAQSHKDITASNMAKQEALSLVVYILAEAVFLKNDEAKKLATETLKSLVKTNSTGEVAKPFISSLEKHLQHFERQERLTPEERRKRLYVVGKEKPGGDI